MMTKENILGAFVLLLLPLFFMFVAFFLLAFSVVEEPK